MSKQPRSVVRLRYYAKRQAIAKRLRDARKKSGQSQETVAAILGMDRVSYTRIEGGKYIMPSEMLVTVATVLKIPVVDLLDEEPTALAA